MPKYFFVVRQGDYTSEHSDGIEFADIGAVQLEAIKSACGKDFLVITPGVRPSGAAIGDQKRVTTPGEAVARGADYIVVGRPITAASSPADAASAILSEINCIVA